MKERISSLIDGYNETTTSLGETVSSVARSDEARRTWETYNLIGDALRREPALEVDLTRDVMSRLESEPTVLSPATVSKPTIDTPAWQRILPIAASVMGVAAVAWVALQVNKQDAVPMLAASVSQDSAVQAVALSSTPRQNLSRDTALRAYVLAHQGTAGGALPGVVPYVRTVAELPQAHR